LSSENKKHELTASKSQRKRDMLALQVLGVRLVALNDRQLAQLDLPEGLFDAIVAAQRISDFEGRRRQMQYIGRLMREIDPQPIAAQLKAWGAGAREHTAIQHSVEQWRVRLLADERELTRFYDEYPNADLQHLRSLIVAVKRDQAEGRTPKRYRELFRVLRNTVSIAQSATPDE
jgi:ribosome-associated protein